MMAGRKRITIRKERFYQHLPEDVWAAITDPRALVEWLEPNNHRLVAGHKFQFRCDPGICGSGETECEVLEADPPRRLVWSWVHVRRSPNHPRPDEARGDRQEAKIGEVLTNGTDPLQPRELHDAGRTGLASTAFDYFMLPRLAVGDSQ